MAMFFHEACCARMYKEKEVDFPKCPCPTSLCIFGDGQTELILFCKHFCVCINTLRCPQLWNKDHASIMVFDHDNGGSRYTPTWE